MDHELILSLGSNIEPKRVHLENAVKKLNEVFIFNKISLLYETEAVDYIEQDDFYNICISYFTEINDPFLVLDKILKIENDLGRDRDVNIPKGPRVIDIDILLFGEYEINTDRLTIPHERMFERRFVLEPLVEILPKSSLFFSKYDIKCSLDKVKMQKISTIGALLS